MSEDRVRTAFSRLRRDVAGTVSASDGLDRLHRRRRVSRALVPAFGFAAVVLLAVGAFAFFTGGESGPVATTGTTAPTTSTLPGSTTTTSPPPEVPQTWARSRDLILATGSDIVVVSDGRTTSISEALDFAPDDLNATLAVSDRAGGIVYQDPHGIWHLAAGSVEPRFLLGPDAGLHDVAVVDGEATLVYVRQRSEGDSTVSLVMLRDLGDGSERLLVESDAFEGGVSRISHGGEMFVITYAAEGIEWFEFFSEDGEPLSIPNPAAFEDVAATIGWVDQAVLSPDGSTLVYLDSVDPWERAEGEPIYLVVWDTRTGTVSSRVPLDLGDVESDRVDFDGRTVVVGTQFGRTQQVPGMAWVITELVGGDGVAYELAPVEGRPALVVAAPPPDDPPPSTTTTIPPAGPGAVIPAEGLPTGYLTADMFGVKWHAGAGFEAPETTATEEDRGVVTLWDVSDDTFQGMGVQAFDDGLGGVVMHTTERGTYWLRAGEPARMVVSPARTEVNTYELLGVADIDGPTAYFMEYGVDGPSVLWTVRLEDGEANDVLRFDSESAWYITVSYGGGRFVINTAGPDCSTTFAADPETGDTSPLAGAPESPCDGLPATWHFQARISPDGTQLAYMEATRVEAGRDLIELTPSVWGSPVDLVVVDLASGRELLRREIADDVLAVTLIHDFDGERIAYSVGPQEPAASTDDFTILDLTRPGFDVTFQAIQTRVGLYR